MKLSSFAVSLLIISTSKLPGTDAFVFFTPFGLKSSAAPSMTLDALYTPRIIQKPFCDAVFEKCESSDLYSEAVKSTSTSKETERVSESKKTATQIPTIPFSITKNEPNETSDTFSNEFTKAVEAMQEKIQQNASKAKKESKSLEEPIEWSADHPTSSFGMNGYSLKTESNTKIPKRVSEIFRKKIDSPVILPVPEASHDTTSETEPLVICNTSSDQCAQYPLSADDWLNGALSPTKLPPFTSNDDLCEIVENIYEDIYNEPLDCSVLFPNEESVMQVPYYIAESKELDAESNQAYVEKKAAALSETEKTKIQTVIENQKKLMEMDKNNSSVHHRITAEDFIISKHEIDFEEERDKVSKPKKEKETIRKVSTVDSPVSTAISNQNQLLASNSSTKRITAEDLSSKHENIEPRYFQESQGFPPQKKVEAFYNMDPITRLPQMVNLKHMNQYSSSSHMTSSDYDSAGGYSEQQMMSLGPLQHGYVGPQSQLGYGGVSEYGAPGGVRSNTMMVSPQGDIVDLKFVGGNPGMSYGTTSSSRYNDSAGINIMGGNYGPSANNGYGFPSPFSMAIRENSSNVGPYGTPNEYGSSSGFQRRRMSNGASHGYAIQGMSNSNMPYGTQSGVSWDSPKENKMILPQSVLGESGIGNSSRYGNK